MKFKNLHDGRPVPVLGLGSVRFGSGISGRSEDVKVLRTALDLGYTHIDTAEGYGHGGSESVIGEAIQGRDRESLFITSKVGRNHLRGEQVMEAIDGSLKRLGTDYLDLYLIHAPDPAVPLEETFEALNQLVEHGKVRYIGVSNFSREQLAKAYSLTHSILATNQVHYSVLHREPEENGVLEACQELDVLLTAYTPTEKGQVASDDTLRQVAERHGATPVQVALAWLMQKPGVITICESHNPAHLEENLKAVDLELSTADLRMLDGVAGRARAVGA